MDRPNFLHHLFNTEKWREYEESLWHSIPISPPTLSVYNKPSATYPQTSLTTPLTWSGVSGLKGYTGVSGFSGVSGWSGPNYAEIIIRILEHKELFLGIDKDLDQLITDASKRLYQGPHGIGRETVDKILEHKELLPLLIGIHNDFDKLIADALKEVKEPERKF